MLRTPAVLPRSIATQGLSGCLLGHLSRTALPFHAPQRFHCAFCKGADGLPLLDTFEHALH